MMMKLKKWLSAPGWAGIAAIVTIIATLLTAYQVSQSLAPSQTAISTIAPNKTLTASDQIRNGCISVSDWTPYGEHAGSFSTPVPVSPIPQSKCWFLYDWGIFVENKGLAFRLNQQNSEFFHYGISTPISPDAVIELTLDLSLMRMDDKFEIGIVSVTSPSSDRALFTVWSTPTAGLEVHGYAMQQNKERLFAWSDFSSGKHKLKMLLTAARLDVFLDDQKINGSPIDVVYSAPRLWIGYQLARLGGDVSVFVSDLSIVNK